MWTCSQCGRFFVKIGQSHSCRAVPLEQHFRNKEKAKGLFEQLLKIVNERVGKCEVISLPCCVHLFGNTDFLAILPKKDKLEIRFGIDRKLDSPRLKQSVPVSAHLIKNCVDISLVEEIDEELVSWLREAFYR